uniref:Solute carrier family 2 member 8 n=1 Tax=Sinocyclocheilus grahami TaxID=75366 RepID=A0A672PYD6_SINGR
FHFQFPRTYNAIISVVTIGAALGGLLGGWAVERIGRKLSLMFCAVPFICGFTVIIAAQSHWMLYVGRVLTGLASGVTSLVVPVSITSVLGPDAPAEWECARIEEAYKNEEQSFSLADLKDPGVFKPLGIGIMMMLLQQMTGINAIMFYAKTIFEQAHFESSDVATVIVAATQVVFTAIAAIIMDKAGRKALLILSAAAYLTLLTTACLCFALGWGPTPWLVMSEIFPTRVRGLGSALCVLTNWTCAFIVTKTFQNLMDAITSAGTFWMFSGLCALNVIFTAIFVPETKGKTLEEIQARFKGTHRH